MVAIFSDSNRARLRYIKEDNAAWGVTPASGKTREIRHTGSTITAQKDTVMSEEIRADRMVPDIIETGARAEGDINIEFSAGSHDDFDEAFMYGAWTRPMTFDTVIGNALAWADTNTLYVNGKDVSDYFVAGHRIRTTGFLTPANNDYFEIDTITWNSGANRTEINMLASTAVAEAGSVFTKMFDANDVVVLKNTTIRFGTAAASTIDSNGGNAFAGGIAAGQLNAGQKIFVETAAAFETGTVTFTDIPASGAKVLVDDGDLTVTFQFGGIFPQTVTGVALASDVVSQAENLVEEINALRVRGELNVSATHVAGAVTIKNLNVTGGAITEVTDVGNHITVVNFANGRPTIRGVFSLTSVSDDVLTVSPHPATFANGSSVPVTVKASMLRNPSVPEDITPQSFSFETGFEDVSQFFIYDGQRVGTFAKSVQSKAILTGSYGFKGRGAKNQSITKLGDAGNYTPLESTSTPVANATSNVGFAYVNGEPVSSAIQSIQISGENNLRDQDAVGNKFPAGIGAGRMELKGSMVVYFADASIWNKFIDHTTVSISFSVEDVDGHHYEFLIPAANFSTDGVSPQGGNQDVLENLEFMAKRDPNLDCQIQIDRFSCVLPITA